MIKDDELQDLLSKSFSGVLSALELSRLNALLANDEEARREYVEHCQMEAMLSRDIGDLTIVDESDCDDPRPSVRFSLWRLNGWVSRGLALSGALAAAILIGLLVTEVGPQSMVTPGEADVAETSRLRATELVRTAQLEDGSTLQMARNSVVTIRYTEAERALELSEGEALFTVTPDSRRPFVVTAGAIRMQAVGTAFNVRKAGDRVVVTVSEGRIRVDAVPAEGLQTPGLIVEAGYQVAWDRPGGEPVLSTVDLGQALGWRNGRLDYRGEPLGAVVADLNRYTSQPIIIQDQSLNSLRVTGTVLTVAIDEWLTSLPDSFAVRVERHGQTRIITTTHDQEPRP